MSNFDISQFLSTINRLLNDTSNNNFADYDCNASIELKLKYFLDNLVIRELFEKQLALSVSIKSGKNLNAAIQLRENGNEYFKKNNMKESIKTYTKSILTCPDGEDLAIAFANRSAVLFHLEFYNDCILDIQRAFGKNYPKHLTYKAYARLGRCLLKLSKKEEARDAFQKALTDLINSNLPENRQHKMTDELNLLLTTCSTETELVKSKNVERLQLYRGEHSVLCNTTSAIELKFNEQQGRYLTSKEEIPVGSVLFIEKPFSSLLLQKYYLDYCFHCFKSTSAGIQCLSCCEIMYCSEDCRSNSWIKYHRYECRQLSFLNEVGIMHLALRLLMAAGLKNALTMKEMKNSRNEIPGINDSKQYDCSYFTVYHLVTNMDKMSEDELVNHALSSCCMIWFLQSQIERLKTFSPSNDEVHLTKTVDCHFYNEDKYYLAYLIMRHSLQLINNAHAITRLLSEKEFEGTTVVNENQERIGVAIYPAASLMNHSCKPNIISSFDKDCLIVRSTRTISAGEEILNCYGPNYLRMEYAERQKSLMEQYKFVCHCEICTEEGDSKAEKYLILGCSFCNGPISVLNNSKSETGKCLHCHRLQNCSQQMEKYLLSNDHFASAISEIEDKAYNTAIENLERCLELRRIALNENNKDIAAVCDQLAKCYALKGDFETSLKFLKLSMELVRKIYGSDSVEYALELPKFTDVLIKLLIDKDVQDLKKSEFRTTLQELLDACEHGIRLLSMYFGEDDDKVKELVEKMEHFIRLKEAVNLI